MTKRLSPFITFFLAACLMLLSISVSAFVSDESASRGKIIAGDVYQGVATLEARGHQGCGVFNGELTSGEVFQGQYEDSETGLYYNRHRYYDPNSGSFVTQDPIKLQGGINNYLYTPNPINWIDPMGLTPEKEATDRQANAVAQAQDQTMPPAAPNADVPKGVAPKGGLETRGYKPKPGERTIEGYVENSVKNANGEITVIRPSGQETIRVGPGGRHRIAGPHTHPTYSNPIPNGSRRIGVSNSARPVNSKDASELYKALESGSYRTRN